MMVARYGCDSMAYRITSTITRIGPVCMLISDGATYESAKRYTQLGGPFTKSLI